MRNKHATGMHVAVAARSTYVVSNIRLSLSSYSGTVGYSSINLNRPSSCMSIQAVVTVRAAICERGFRSKLASETAPSHVRRLPQKTRTSATSRRHAHAPPRYPFGAYATSSLTCLQHACSEHSLRQVARYRCIFGPITLDAIALSRCRLW